MKAASILSDSYFIYKDYLIELKDIDIISVHPSIKGMQQIANQVVSSME